MDKETKGRRQVRLYYSSTSRRLIDDIRILLLRFNVLSRVKTTQKGTYRPNHNLLIYGRNDQLRFLQEIGVHGARGERIPAACDFLESIRSNTNVDVLPIEVWQGVRTGMATRGVTARALAQGLGMAYCGSTLYKAAPSRERLERVATVLQDDELHRLASSDVFWDRIVSIAPQGEMATFDATVPGTHNFIANGVVVHNSIEQDSDVVMFVYREEYYKPEDPTLKGKATIMIAKQRNGPTGDVDLTFLREFTKFVPYSPIMPGETDPDF